ncbi:MAG TPA: rhomboid family intramembrane serine protease, partial [Tepidisphaeraceae bacterium]
MIIPLGTDSRLRHTPYVNWAMIAINVIVFVIVQHLYRVGGHWVLNMADVNSLTTSQFDLPPVRPELYEFVTYAFMHAS